ncbi:MAG: hypothetical protein LUH43_06540 [Clostridia bacterium]|nr:hypothetical protein [Clostridia bacterium]
MSDNNEKINGKEADISSILEKYIKRPAEDDENGENLEDVETAESGKNADVSENEQNESDAADENVGAESADAELTASGEAGEDATGADVDMFGAYGHDDATDDFADLDSGAIGDAPVGNVPVGNEPEVGADGDIAADENENEPRISGADENAADENADDNGENADGDEDADADANGENANAEDDDEDVEIDDFDMNIMLGLGLEDELQETVGTDKVMKFVARQQADIAKAQKLNEERASLDFEYTAKSQKKDIMSAYAGQYTTAKLKLAASVLFAFVLLLFECRSLFGIELTGAFDPTIYPVVYIMVGLQIVFFIAVLGIKPMRAGIAAFFHGKPSPECVAAAVLLADIIYSAVISIYGSFGSEGPETFNFTVAVCFVMLYVYELLNLRSEIYSFSIVASKNVKYALTGLPISKAHRELEAFSDMMDDEDDPDDINVLRVERSDFVNDFFLRTNHYPSGRKFIGFVIPAIFVISAAFFAYKYSTTSSVYEGIYAAAKSFFTCMPVSLFFMFSMPFCRATEKAHANGDAIIGEASVDEYSDAAVVSFDDTNVFGRSGVSVREINMFDNARIDRVFYYAASVFCTTGGPLSNLFERVTKDIGHSDDVTLMRCIPGLIEAQVNGNFIAIGTLDVLEREGRRVPRKLKALEEAEIPLNASAMYMVLNGKFVARILTEYKVSPDFESTLADLDKSGLYVGIRTFDPNLTEEFLGRMIDMDAYQIRIIRCNSIDDRLTVSEEIRSGLISKDSSKSLLTLVGLCERIMHVRSINTMTVVISIFAGLLIATLSILFGAIPLTSLSIAVYQLLWMIPMLIISLALI